MALEPLESQASQLLLDDGGNAGSDYQSFLSHLWRQTQQAVKTPPAKRPDPPTPDPGELVTHTRYRYD